MNNYKLLSIKQKSIFVLLLVIAFGAALSFFRQDISLLSVAHAEDIGVELPAFEGETDSGARNLRRVLLKVW